MDDYGPVLKDSPKGLAGVYGRSAFRPLAGGVAVGQEECASAELPGGLRARGHECFSLFGPARSEAENERRGTRVNKLPDAGGDVVGTAPGLVERVSTLDDLGRPVTLRRAENFSEEGQY
jgi:hypothetical protein